MIIQTNHSLAKGKKEKSIITLQEITIKLIFQKIKKASKECVHRTEMTEPRSSHFLS